MNQRLLNVRPSLIGLVFLLLASCNLGAQNYVIIEGRLVNTGGQPLQNAHILNLSKKLGTISDAHGLFRIIASPHDSMLVSMVGYKPYRVTVPSNLMYKVINIKVTLLPDTIMLREAIIRGFPPTYELFKKEFVTLKLKKTPNEKLFSKVADKQYNPKGGIVLTGPISLLYEAFSKDAKNRRKLADLVYKDNLRGVVYDKIPKEVLIKAYHLNDEAHLEQFLDFCQMPEYLIVNGTPYELVLFMNGCNARFPRAEN